MSEFRSGKNNSNPPNPPIPPILDGYVDRTILAREFGVCERTILRWQNEPDGLPFIKVGAKTLYRVDAVRQWLASRTKRRNRKDPRNPK